jgi:hypothetical protein
MSDPLQKSTQENTQDLDQNQEVDVKPSQVNVQRIDVVVNTKLENYAAKITGNIYSESKLIPDADVLLFFGFTNSPPIYQTISDSNGNFLIVDLPPGFYTLKASFKGRHHGTILNIKLMPGQNYECSMNLIPMRPR